MTVCAIPECGLPVKGRGWCRKHYLRWYKHGDPLHLEQRRGICSVEGCDDKHHAKELCASHYYRLWRSGDPLPPERPTICGVSGCVSAIYAKGLCGMHYQRVRHHGSVADPRVPFEDRFWAKVDKDADCWEWRGSRNHKGYGLARRRDGKGIQAHRLAYELTVGPIPEGLEIDHLCVNRGCVNPSHLEPVTHTENIRRGYARRRAG